MSHTVDNPRNEREGMVYVFKTYAQVRVVILRVECATRIEVILFEPH